MSPRWTICSTELYRVVVKHSDLEVNLESISYLSVFFVDRMQSRIKCFLPSDRQLGRQAGRQHAAAATGRNSYNYKSDQLHEHLLRIDCSPAERLRVQMMLALQIISPHLYERKT
jgi:hypothetical protein